MLLRAQGLEISGPKGNDKNCNRRIGLLYVPREPFRGSSCDCLIKVHVLRGKMATKDLELGLSAWDSGLVP